MRTPEILHIALRQYRHNSGGNTLFAGFDYEETVKIVTALEAVVQEQRELLDRLIHLVDDLENTRPIDSMYMSEVLIKSRAHLEESK